MLRHLCGQETQDQSSKCDLTSRPLFDDRKAPLKMLEALHCQACACIDVFDRSKRVTSIMQERWKQSTQLGACRAEANR
jgi:hypothetical protein